MENDALYNICRSKQRIESPSFDALNSLVATAFTGITSSMRFTGQHHSSMRKLMTNLNAFPRFKYFVSSFTPFAGTDP